MVLKMTLKSLRTKMLVTWKFKILQKLTFVLHCRQLTYEKTTITSGTVQLKDLMHIKIKNQFLSWFKQHTMRKEAILNTIPKEPQLMPLEINVPENLWTCRQWLSSETFVSSYESGRCWKTSAVCRFVPLSAQKDAVC